VDDGATLHTDVDNRVRSLSERRQAPACFAQHRPAYWSV